MAVASAGEGTLHKNAIGLAEVLFQSVTAMAPASVWLSVWGRRSRSPGRLCPLATLIALIACMLIAVNIGAMAKYLPSAGGYFTYVSRGLGDAAGWFDRLVIQPGLHSDRAFGAAGPGAARRRLCRQVFSTSPGLGRLVCDDQRGASCIFELAATHVPALSSVYSRTRLIAFRKLASGWTECPDSPRPDRSAFSRLCLSIYNNV